MANPTKLYLTSIGLQQPSASDLTDGTTGTGTVALSASPALTGTPTAPTQAATDNSTDLATTAFAQAMAGGVNAQTINYTALAADKGKVISMNGSSLTLTLPSPPPTVKWWIAIENINATTLTISRNGLTIDGAAGNLSLAQNQGVLIFTDGTNYFTMRGFSASGITLETNGTPNGSQTLLNLIAGSNMTITDGGSGGITFASGTASANAGGVVSKTINYTQLAADSGKLITMNGSSLTLTLDATPTDTEWIAVENTNATSLTISRNGLNIDGAASNLTLSQNQGVLLFSDGTNWFSSRGMGSGGGSSFTINGGSPSGTANFNNITPASPFGAANINWQLSGSSISAYVPGSVFNKTSYNLAGRSLGTIFQNTTGFPVFVMAAAGSSGSTISAVCDASATPTTIVNEQTTSNGFAASFFFIVPNNDFYEISGSGAVFSNWTEWSLNTGSVTFSGELSGSRSLGTVFQNTTGFSLFVVADISGIGSTVTIQGISDSAASPTTVVWSFQPPVSSANVTLFMIIPNNHFYKVTSSSGGAVAHWNEYTMPFNVTKSIDLAASPAQRQEISSGGLDTPNTFVSPVWSNVTLKDMFAAVVESDSSTSTMVARSGPTPTPNTPISAVYAVSNNANNPTSSFMVITTRESYLFGRDAATVTTSHWWEYYIQ